MKFLIIYSTQIIFYINEYTIIFILSLNIYEKKLFYKYKVQIWKYCFVKVCNILFEIIIILFQIILIIILFEIILLLIILIS